MKLKELLQQEKEKLIKEKVEDANIIARILLQNVLNISRTELIQNELQEIEEENIKKYEEKIEKIIQGIPLQYITHCQEFYGLNFYVNENVLIPQPDTEILVQEVLYIAKKQNKKSILDLCTGSGCIGISIAKKVTNVQITMSDISCEALKVANINAKENNVIEKINILKSDLFEKVQTKFDIIVSNPPYIESKQVKMLSKQVQNEPILALDGGEDGHEFYKKIIQQAHNYLNENGYLCLEIGYNQKKEVIDLLEKSKKYKNIYSKKDLAGNDRIIVCMI